MADGGERKLDLSQAIEQGTQRTTLSDLEKKGVKNVKILDEKQLQELVTKAVDRVITTQTAEQREKMLSDSRRELERLMREHRAARTRAQLLESDKNELIEQVEALQKELSLQAELEEENLQKKFLEGTASMERQVEELRVQLKAERDRLERELAEERAKAREASAQFLRLQEDAAAAAQEGKTLKAELVRQRAEIVQLKEGGAAAAAERRAREEAEHAKWMLESRLADLQRQFDALQEDGRAGRAEARKAEAELQRVQAALEGEKSRAEAFRAKAAEIERLQAEIARLEKQAAGLREELEKSRQAGAVESAVLQERVLEVEHLKAKVLEEHERAEALAEAGRRLRDELDATRRAAAVEAAVLQERVLEVEHLKAKVLEEHERAESLAGAGRKLRDELEKVRRAAAVESAVLKERVLEVEVLKKQALEAHGRAEEVERGLRAELERAAQALEAERARRGGELEELRRELERQRAQQEGSVVLAAEIQKIEDVRHAEERELERLRAEAAALRDHEARLRAELGEARIDLRSLYEIVAREQGLARTAQDEAVSLHAKALELQGRLGELRAAPAPEPRIEKLQDALARAKAELAKKAAPDPRVAELQASLAREKKAAEARLKALAAKKAAPDPKATARIAALESALKRARTPAPAGTRRLARKVAKLETALLRARKKKEAAPAAGVGLDGRGLLEDFLRRIQLKELFQKHVPVQDPGGRRHPSETLLELVQAVAAGPRTSRAPGARLELFGAPGRPTLDELKAFQARLAPRAVRQIERVHDGLRHQLVPLPPKGERLVLDLDMPALDVGKKGRLGAYRPLVCFDGRRGEFWKARLRTSKAPENDGVLPFLRACLSKVPRGFARGRVLLRLDARFFSEPVLRFLERSGAGYAMPAPDSKELRAAARKAPLREISGGWSVGAFEMRVHPIRATKGRFVVLRRRASKPGPAPTFADGTHAYHVLLADRNSGPWRAWSSLEGRTQALESARALLAGWAESPLLGRGRRARTAAFTIHLLASDLLQWFKRAGLPPAEQARSPESLRKEVLLLAPPEAKRRETTVLVLPKRDRRRRLYGQVTERLSRLRTSAPFKLGR